MKTKTSRIYYATISHDGSRYSYHFENIYGADHPASCEGYDYSTLARGVEEHGVIGDAPLFDWRTADEAEAVKLAIRGPMCNPSLPYDIISVYAVNITPDPSKDFFGATSLDYISLDLYTRLCKEYGVSVTPLIKWLEENKP